MHWEEREGGRAFVFDFATETGQAFAYLRQYFGISQKKLGETIGVTQQQISQYERTGYVGASWSRLKEINWALEKLGGGKTTITIPLHEQPPKEG